jgi:hypothetical protein
MRSSGCCRRLLRQPEAAQGQTGPRALYSLFANAEWPGVTVARSASNPQLLLRPQDLVALLRLALDPGPAPTDAALGSELGLMASEVGHP